MDEAVWLEAGDKAPAFSLKDQHGKTIKSSELKGKPVVVYFYPKDDTPGCTKEACAFRDCQHELEAAGAVLLGVSPDDQASHQKFSDKFALNFSLLVDKDHQLADKFGAWREKNMYGKKSFGIQRSTFLIDAQGKVAKVWKRVQMDGHDQQVLAALRELPA
jgi:peroxiredoxin Q/BCP